MNTSKHFVVVALLSLLSVVLSLQTLDPEQAAFISTRCHEDHAEDKECKMECILLKSGLFDPWTKKFVGDVIRIQWDRYPDLVPKEKAEAFASAVDKLPPAGQSCLSVYRAYKPILEEFKETARDLFHGNQEKAKKIYDELGDKIKQPGQSVFHFCENKFYPAGSPNRKEICEMRQFKVLDNETYKKRVDCVYKLLRYITEDGKIDMLELKRDFKLIGKDEDQLFTVLGRCRTTQPKDALSRPRHYYKCLVESEIGDDYKEAVDYREIRSMDYNYNPKDTKYDKAAVAKKVKELDAMQCPET